jgi:dihydroorotase
MSDSPTRYEKADRIILREGLVIDPSVPPDQPVDLFIVDGRIERVGRVENVETARVIDCTGKVITPGFVDMHVHLREPGREDEETVESGLLAAASGGFTAVAAMPNTEPAMDTRSVVEFVLERASGSLTACHPVAAVTKGRAGAELTEMADLIEAGAMAFSDDGNPIEKASVLRRALEYADRFGQVVIDHCEDKNLSEGGSIHEGVVSAVLGIRPIPSLSEDVAVARDLMTAEYAGCKIHIAHVSTAGSVRLIREAKARGIRVTAETCPHYLILTDEAVREFDTNAKMNPPLRAEADRQALLEALRDGTIDAITTDHAPHAIEEKDAEFDAAPFGIVGLETAVGLALTRLVHEGILSISQFVEKMAIAPRRILGLAAVSIQPGQPADLTILDLNRTWRVDKTRFLSRSRNTPFDGWDLKGRAIGVIRGGRMFLNID